MKRSHKRIVLCVSLCGFVISYIMKIDYDVSLLNSIMTVLSIIMGFNVTAISTLYSKKFICILHRRIDKDLPGQTQLQTLKNYFALNSNMTLVTIVYLILYQLIITKCHFIVLTYLDVEMFLSSLILPLVLINISFIMLLSKVILKGLIYEAEEN